MLFGGLGAVHAGPATLLVAAPMLAWSAWRWHRARRAWATPRLRALVTVTVAA
jgi:hypothetical protein